MNLRERSNFTGEQPVARDFHPRYDRNGNRPNHSDVRHHDLNGNRPNHSDATPVTEQFHTGPGTSQNHDFLGHRLDRLEKLIHSLVQDKGQGLRRW